MYTFRVFSSSFLEFRLLMSRVAPYYSSLQFVRLMLESWTMVTKTNI